VVVDGVDVVVGALVAGLEVVDASTVVLVRISSSAESSPDPQATRPDTRPAASRTRPVRVEARRRVTPRV
jgi:hypothetical protein